MEYLDSIATGRLIPKTFPSVNDQNKYRCSLGCVRGLHSFRVSPTDRSGQPASRNPACKAFRGGQDYFEGAGAAFAEVIIRSFSGFSRDMAGQPSQAQSVACNTSHPVTGMPPMNNEATSILTKACLLRIRELHFSRLKRLFANEDDAPCAFVLSGVSKGIEATLEDSAQSKMDEALLALAREAEALTDLTVFRPLVVEFGLYGVHFIDKILGVDVFDLNGSWQVKLLNGRIGELMPPELHRNQVWILAQDLARAFVASGATVPLFGVPTISSALNVAVNLYGQEFLAAMIEEPERALHDLRIIKAVLCELHRWYLANVPIEQLQPVVGAFRTQPPGFGQLCVCTTQLLSPELYRDFVAPLDEQLLSVYPGGGMIHLCGKHSQHIPVWRGMRLLRSVQLNDSAAEDLGTYFKELRPDQILCVTPCVGMPVELIMAITGGKRVVIVADKVQVQQLIRNTCGYSLR